VDRFRLRGTWEEDPAPIPFPGKVAGRDAGVAAPSPASKVSETKLSDRTRELMTNVDQDLDRLQLKFDEFTHLLDAEEEAGYDDPSAA
jgi:hypothetical protein